MNIKDVENLAELARINLTNEEKNGLLNDFDSILAYVDTIKNVDVKHSVSDITNYNIWREDKIEPRDFEKKLITDQFPDSQDGFLKVKKIL
jgi:aspartyl-tRNA(Asn)/glutamyl-tRNA(Gln) amidotransferase subunit C